MFHLTDPLLICMNFGSFMHPVGGSQGLLSIGRGMRVEYPNIKVGTLMSATPKPISSYVQSGLVFSVGSGPSKHFSRQRLQVWFHAYIIAHFRQPAAYSVPYLVVPDGREPTLWAREGMLNCEVRSTGTMGRQVGWKPTILEGQGISEGSFV